MASGFFNEVYDREHAIFFLTTANGGSVISYQDAIKFSLKLGLNMMIIEQAALLSDFFNGGSVFDWKRFCTFAYLCRAINQGYILTTPLDLKWRQVPIPNLESIRLQLHSMGMSFGSINKPNVGVYQSSTPTPFDERKSGENWNLSANLKAKYAQRFNQLDTQRKDSLDPNVVTRVLRESNLPNHVLAKVWEFCCGSGPISRGRFIAAVFMAEKLAEGYTLPSKLPDELISVITGMPTAYSPATIQTLNHGHGGMTFEEKRMDNLKRSEAVLQPRREALLEQEQAQKALLMRKQEEERLRREQEQQEFARQKLIESLKYEVKELDGKKKDLTRLVERLSEENLNIQHEIEKAEFTLQGIEENTKELSSEFQKDVEIFRNMTQVHSDAKTNFEKCIHDIDKYTREIHLLAQEIAQNSHEMLQLKSRFASNPELVQLEETKNELSQDIDHLKNEIEALKEVASNEEIFEAKAQHLEKENAQKFSTLNSTLMVAAENYMEKYNELNTKGTAKGMINLDKLYQIAKEGKPLLAFPNASEVLHNDTTHINNSFSSSHYPNPFADNKNEENIDPFANVERIDDNFSDPFSSTNKNQDDDFFSNDPFKSNTIENDNQFNEPWPEIKESNSFTNNVIDDKKDNQDAKTDEHSTKNSTIKNSFEDPFASCEENGKALANGSVKKDEFLCTNGSESFQDIKTSQYQIEDPFNNANVSSTSDKFIGNNKELNCYIALHDFEAPKDDAEALSFTINSMCITNQPENGEWVYGVINDKAGYVPTNYFKLIDDFSADTETIRKVEKIIENGLSKQNSENPFAIEDTSDYVHIYPEETKKTSTHENHTESMNSEARMITAWKYEFNGESCFIKQGEMLPVIEQLDVQTKVLHNGREILIPKALLSAIDGTSLNKSTNNTIKNSKSSNCVQNSYVKSGGMGETRSLQELQEKIRTDLTFSDTKASRTEEHLARLHSPRSSQNKIECSSKIAVAEYDFEPRSDDELRFKKGDKIIVIDTTDGSWGRGYLVNSADTTPMYFPMNFSNSTVGRNSNSKF